MRKRKYDIFLEVFIMNNNVKKRSKKTGKENPEMGEKGPLNEVILVILNTS